MTTLIDRLLELHFHVKNTDELIEFESIKKQLEEMEVKAEKYDMMERSFNVCIAEKIELHGYYLEYQILKSGLEEICNSIDYDYNPMDTEERMKKLLEKVNKK